LSTETVTSLCEGSLVDETSLPILGKALGLEPNSLVLCAMKLYRPRVSAPDGLECFNTSYHSGMTVNSFVVWDPKTRGGAVFDTGTDAFPLLDWIKEQEISVKDLFLTHTHPDHLAEVDAISGRLGGIPVRCNAEEPHPNTELFQEGDTFAIGGLRVDTRTTKGHSPGGTTYVIEGLDGPLAIVGDALFAGSMGGGMVSFQDALQTNRDHIFTLPDEAILCPGHGPLTTLAQEKRNNPFFAMDYV
ncbi:MAG: MBL fold metallo-hydrolase, partial [Verrucomicrobiota bacterium]